ncbi:hypothetical protein OG373_05535 [Streptomyces avidinii]|uniref:hypothetical protein n=1 Tax=Streptomyces avidinii TaxID=1895 RepID=UPI003870A6A0|nr:hypothetical protein OG373_05535 [Streptomyces avidinii]
MDSTWESAPDPSGAAARPAVAMPGTGLPHDKPLYEVDVHRSGPIADHNAHLPVLRDAAY